MLKLALLIALADAVDYMNYSGCIKVHHSHCDKAYAWLRGSIQVWEPDHSSYYRFQNSTHAVTLTPGRPQLSHRNQCCTIGVKEDNVEKLDTIKSLYEQRYGYNLCTMGKRPLMGLHCVRK